MGSEARDPAGGNHKFSAQIITKQAGFDRLYSARCGQQFTYAPKRLYGIAAHREISRSLSHRC
jgi:hypothetical protein